MKTITPPSFRQLSAEELATYHENGFVSIPDFMTREELTLLNEDVERIQQAKLTPDKTRAPMAILSLGLQSEMMQRMVADERILALIEPLVFPGIAIYSAKLVQKLPNDNAVCHWHQDDAYYRANSESECRMSIWLPLQDCDERNGCVWMVPGSHKHGLRPYHEIETGQRGHCKLGFAPAQEDVPGAVPIRVKAGSIVLFHALTWHRSLGNQTANYRRAFIVSYQDAIAAQGNGQQHRVLRSPAETVAV